MRFEGGRYRIAGTDRSAGFAEVVRASFDATLRPEAETLGLDCEINHVAPAVTFANGCHVCEVEIEQATGLVRIVRYTAVDDLGGSSIRCWRRDRTTAPSPRGSGRR